MASFDLTKGPVGPQLTRMTIPFFLGISSMIMASMIETIYIGVLGADELAAYSFTFPLMMALTSISMGVGVGASSLIARAEGEGDRDQVRRIATHTMILTFGLTLMVCAAVYSYLGGIFSLMGAEGEVLRLVVEFSQIWVLGLLFFTFPMVGSNVLRSLGIAKTPGYVMALTSLLQLVVSPILIFGLLGFPALGFTGSAYAFIVIGVVRVFSMGLLVINEDILNWQNLLGGFAKSTRDIMQIALPAMLTSLIGPVSMAVTIALLAAHGSVVVAAFGIVSRVEMLVTMVLGALSSSVAPFAGQNWGARKTQRIYEGLKLADRFSLLWGLCCFILLAPFGAQIVGLINDEPMLSETANWYLIIVPISYGLLGVGQNSSSLFIALGKPIPPTILAAFRMVVVYVPLALLFDFYWGFIGIFIALAVANVLMGIGAFIWARMMLRREIKLFGLDPVGLTPVASAHRSDG